jgi:renalase
MKALVAVIGAGISGLLAARAVAEHGGRVVVLEKSRGVGGRMATKRFGTAVFDQGAQFFTARDPRFEAEVAAWSRAGVAGPWPGGEPRRQVGRPSMTAAPKHLARDLDVRLEHKVTAVRHHACACWEIEIEGQGVWRAERLVLSSPVPQSLALLAAGGVDLPPSLQTELATLDYHPCLAWLAQLDGPGALPRAGVAPAEGPVRWVADNVVKGLAEPAAGGAWTVHTTPEFAAAHYADDETVIAPRLLPHLSPWLDGARVVASRLHRWRYSEPKRTWSEPCLWLPEMKLGFCGDAFGGPKVEGAALSGLAMGDQLAADLRG